MVQHRFSKLITLRFKKKNSNFNKISTSAKRILTHAIKLVIILMAPTLVSVERDTD